MRIKLTQKVDYFIVFENFSSTSCCSQNSCQIRWKNLDVRGSVRDVYIGWVAGNELVGKRL